MREQLTKFEDDGVAVILDWDELNTLYSVNVTVVPELQVNISRSLCSSIIESGLQHREQHQCHSFTSLWTKQCDCFH